MGKKYSDEDRKRMVEERGYELLEISREKQKNRMFVFITIKCPKGHISKMKWDNFKQGKGCKYCANNTKFTYEEVKEYIENFGYKLLSKEYESGKEKVLVKCPNPNHEPYEVRFSAFKNQNQRCEKCSREIASEKRKHSYNFVKEFIEFYGYKLLSNEYKGSLDKLDLMCPNGHKFKMSFEKFYNAGHRCVKCSESKGEREITRILNQYNIKNISQYKFDDCKFKQSLPFDFYLPDYNVLIEYDGEQHYKIFDYFGGLDKFVDTKIRDTIKNEYCNKNNIKLIRIPYWDYNKIEDILKCELNL